jgi:hypothetical protein
VLVNGLRVSTAVLHGGDQLAFGRDHFVVEAPGMPLRAEMASDGTSLDAGHDAEISPGSAGPADTRGSIWWLIGAAALIALGLVWMLLRGA